jgi:hypothetical protein
MPLISSVTVASFAGVGAANPAGRTNPATTSPRATSDTLLFISITSGADYTTWASPTSFTPDGRRLVFSELTHGAGAEIRTVPVERGSGQLQAGKAEFFARLATVTSYPAFSPDGRWLAYADAPAGSYEVYVQAFPDKGTQVQVSNAGGTMPVWSRNGHELFYRTEDQRIMVANYTVKGEKFEADKPRVWFGKRLANVGLTMNFDLAPDGKRFVVLMPAESPEPREAQNHVSRAPRRRSSLLTGSRWDFSPMAN